MSEYDITSIRVPAHREVEARIPGEFSSHLSQYKQGFRDGAEWGAARVTPTRERLAEVIAKCEGTPYPLGYLEHADEVLELILELAKGD